MSTDMFFISNIFAFNISYNHQIEKKNLSIGLRNGAVQQCD